jgi:ADP-ribose pyrophosphatase
MIEWRGAVADTPDGQQVVRSERRFTGMVWSIRTDEVLLDDGQVVVRDVVEHPGAVGVVALDDDGRVLLVRQYRHPVRAYLWEAPAGLLDIEGEDPLAAARRELYEEAGLRASNWHVLVDYFNSPGGSDEMFRCYLARDLTLVDAHERHVGVGEERDMPTTWLPLEDAVRMVLGGALHNPTTVSGVLATYVARAGGWAGLRAADAPWPERMRHREA